MAVIYKTSGVNFTIGGEINPTTGLAGPFPRYSISREPIKKDTLNIANKYSITITGTALIKDASSMLVAGERQDKIHGIIKDILFSESRQGVLEIAPYGGLSNILVFNDAVLVGCESPEQTDTSQGVQSQEYTFTFEAYNLSVNNENIDGTIETIANTNLYNLEDVSESWEYSVSDGDYTQLAFEVDNTSKAIFRNYTITHTISAKGRPQQPSPGTSLETRSGYIEAKNFVEDRLVDLGRDPFAITVLDYSRTTPQQIALRDTITDTNILAYNQVNTYSKDILEGTYSVTRTWTASRYPASCVIDFSLNEDPSAEFNTVEFSASITGYETFLAEESIDRSNSNKYLNAKNFFDDSLNTSIYTLVDAFHLSRFPDRERPLRATPSSFSQTHSQTNGTISISATYDDGFTPFENVLTQTISMTSNNEDGGDNIVAILPVIAKSDGPIIQNMNTTKERTRSITLEWLMAKNSRVSKPSTQAEAYVEANYKPNVDNVYRQNKTETWNPFNGSYNLSIEYVWTKNTPSN